MATRSDIILTAAIAVIVVASGKADARETQNSPQAIMATAGNGTIGGISADRIAASKRRLWRSIQDIVLSRDKSGRMKCPKLAGLWRDVETSGHVIHIELSDDESLSRAGQFHIEVFDPNGLRHVAVIRLNLPTIDRICTGIGARRAGGWMPFSGLKNVERYAEVLGHELAHALYAFQDPEYLRIYQELEFEASQLTYGPRGLEINGKVLARLDRIAQLTRQIEAPAEAAEAEIWRELSRRQ